MSRRPSSGARRATSDEQPMGGGEAHAGHARDERTLDYARLSGHIEAFGRMRSTMRRCSQPSSTTVAGPMQSLCTTRFPSAADAADLRACARSGASATRVLATNLTSEEHSADVGNKWIAFREP